MKPASAIPTFQERRQLYRSGQGYYLGLAVDFNTRYAVDEVRLWVFWENTQRGELAKLQSKVTRN